MSVDKPFSPASERNRAPILQVLRPHFATRRRVLEIGSGTGQHAVHFAAAMPWLTWQCSDRADALPGLRQWLDEAALPNTPAPVELDVALDWSRVPASMVVDAGNTAAPLAPQPGRRGFDAVFSANTLHIMGWTEVEACFAGLAGVLDHDATIVFYGPFNIGGAFTSASNRDFDASLKSRDPRMGIRDLEAVDALANRIGLQLVENVAMPANNRCVVWRQLVPDGLSRA